MWDWFNKRQCYQPVSYSRRYPRCLPRPQAWLRTCHFDPGEVSEGNAVQGGQLTSLYHETYIHAFAWAHVLRFHACMHVYVCVQSLCMHMYACSRALVMCTCTFMDAPAATSISMMSTRSSACGDRGGNIYPNPNINIYFTGALGSSALSICCLSWG